MKPHPWYYTEYEDFQSRFMSAECDFKHQAPHYGRDVDLRRVKAEGARTGGVTAEGKTFKTQHAEWLECLQTQLAAARAQENDHV